MGVILFHTVKDSSIFASAAEFTGVIGLKHTGGGAALDVEAFRTAIDMLILSDAFVGKGAGRGGAAGNVTTGLALLLVHIAQGRIAAIGRHVIARCRVGVAAFVAASPVLVSACVAIGDAAIAGIAVVALAAACCVGFVSLRGVGQGAKLAVYIVAAFGAAYAVTGVGAVCVFQAAEFCVSMIALSAANCMISASV